MIVRSGSIRRRYESHSHGESGGVAVVVAGERVLVGSRLMWIGLLVCAHSHCESGMGIFLRVRLGSNERLDGR